MKYVIDPNLSKKTAYQTALAVCERLRKFSAQICMAEQLAEVFGDQTDIAFLPKDQLLRHADFAIAIGGDGTILRTARQLLTSGHSDTVKVVGINTGTLGFLAAFESDELDLLDRLETGTYSVTSRMMLQAGFPGSTPKPARDIAMNDIYASRMNGKICDFAVEVDGQQIGVFRADGIIFSTPTGSSAYALSAGGPIIEPDLDLIEMNLICPHSLFARPMLFSPLRTVCVTYRGAGDGGLNVHVDGTQTAVLHNAESFSVTCAKQHILFVSCKGQTFYDTLSGKLMQPLKKTE